MLTHENFAALLNTKFKVEREDGPNIELHLEEVSELKVSARQEEFSIVFRGPGDTALGQGIRRLNHEQMGEFDLFLVPISRDAEGYRYESVFNRVRDPEKSASTTS